MHSLGNQLRHLGRRLMRSPMFTVVTLVTLAVGIGANTAIFSVVNGVLLRPLPYQEPERLVGGWHTAPGLKFDKINASPSTHFTYAEESRVFENVGLWNNSSVTVTGLAEPEQIDAVGMTYQTLPVLRVQPVIGRGFSSKDDDPGSPETVILSHAYWQRRFGGDPTAVGRRLILDGKARDIIGVLPQNFQFLTLNPAVILPLQFKRAEVFFGNFSFQALARLKPGVTIQQANADVARMIPMMFEKFPLPPGMNMEMVKQVRLGPNLHSLKEDVVGDGGRVLWVLLGTVGIVLLIACADG